MNRRALILFAGLLVSSFPALAYEYTWDCRGNVTWPSNNVTFEPSLTSFPVGTQWNAAVEAMRTIWNTETPGGRYQIQHTWVTGGTTNSEDGRNAILIPQPAQWAWGGALAVTVKRRSTCNWWPFARAEIREADIFFNPNVWWEHNLNPVPPLPQFGPFNSILVGVHEHGHAFGLAHENDVMATMNEFYPDGGVIGNGNEILPHADDTLADRAGYGTAVTARDVAASAFRRTGAGTSLEIPAPASSNRNAVLSFPFTVENRGTTNESVQVRFYLSPDRNITTGDFFLGSTTLSLNSGTLTTPNAFVTIPANAPTGFQFLGWVADPLNAIAESDEGNNGVGLVAATNILTNRAPSACFTLSPSSGPEPLFVSFDASCSSDPDGDALTYFWDFGDGNSGFGVNPYHIYYQQGFFYVTLTVQDASGATSTYSNYVSVTCSSGGSGGFECPIF